MALLHQQLGVLAVQRPALGLDVGSHRAADVGALIPGQAALAQGGVDDLGGALHQAALVGILNAEDELAAAVAGDEPGVEGGAEVAHVHVARGAKRVRTPSLGMRASISSNQFRSIEKTPFLNFITLFYIFRLRIVKAIWI